MSTIHQRIDPELRVLSDELMDAFPGGVNGIADITQRRAISYAMAATGREDASVLRSVSWEDRWIETSEGQRVKLRVYRPRGEQSDGALLYLHSGGMILGDLEWEHVPAATLCSELSIPVVAVDYRLAPEHPYPAALEDCLAALRWMVSATEVGITHPERYIVLGPSAGGGLSLATTLRARDAGDVLPAFVLASAPMIDDRPTPSSREIAGIGVWDREHNEEGWRWYLGDAEADQYAAPARADDLTGFPPTFIDVGELDVFRDEDISFAHRLLQSGVPTELHVYPGAFHGSDGIVPDAAISRRAVRTRLEALRTAVASMRATTD